MSNFEMMNCLFDYCSNNFINYVYFIPMQNVLIILFYHQIFFSSNSNQEFYYFHIGIKQLIKLTNQI